MLVPLRYRKRGATDWQIAKLNDYALPLIGYEPYIGGAKLTENGLTQLSFPGGEYQPTSTSVRAQLYNARAPTTDPTQTRNASYQVHIPMERTPNEDVINQRIKKFFPQLQNQQYTKKQL